MDKNRPISRELEAVLPALAHAQKGAMQALAQCGAIAELLIEKGIVTKAELDGKMAQGRQAAETLMKVLDGQIGKQS